MEPGPSGFGPKMLSVDQDILHVPHLASEVACRTEMPEGGKCLPHEDGLKLQAGLCCVDRVFPDQEDKK